jgi:hypothetical protein
VRTTLGLLATLSILVAGCGSSTKTVTDHAAATSRQGTASTSSGGTAGTSASTADTKSVTKSSPAGSATATAAGGPAGSATATGAGSPATGSTSTGGSAGAAGVGSSTTSGTQGSVRGNPGPSTSGTNVVHVATFRSPSGNIGCMIIAGTARCDIKHRTWSPGARPKSCPTIVDYGQGLIVTKAGTGRLVCAGDTTLDPSAKAVPYGTATVVGGFRCSSASIGVTCARTSTGHGFFISIGSYRTF